MKRVLFLFFVPFVAFATCEDCQQTVVSLLDRASEASSMSSSVQESASSIIDLQLPRVVRSLQSQYPDVDFSYLSTSVNTADFLANEIQNSNNVVRVRLDSIITTLNSFSCDCESASSCGCAEELVKIGVQLSTIEGSLSTIVSSLSTVEINLISFIDEITNDVQDGFYNVSNRLEDVISSIDSIFTNRVYWAINMSPNPYSNSTLYYMLNTGVASSTPFPYLKSNYSSSISDAIKGLSYGASRALYSLNNYEYDFSFRRFPVLTNTVGTLTRDSTNFFSFFRGEVGVRGVLEDWTEQDGSYYDFLTNHYIQVVTGGTLSGNQSQKTNWFARVETLLASLVFTDSESTNTVDSSTAEQQSKEITSHFEEINTLASNVVQDFSEKSEDIVELFRSWCQQFDSAALPSHVVLFTVPSEGEDLVIQFSLSDTPEVVAMVEGMRAITTFCWASVGIFLLYKFIVWSARCVFVACQFIYKAVSAIFK